MFESKGSFKNEVRFAIIESVNYTNQTVMIRMLDRIDSLTYDCPLPHIAAMNNSGVFLSPTIGSIVFVSFTYREAPIILGFLPLSSYSQDLTLTSNTSNFFYSDSQYPTLKPGEIAIKGINDSQILFSNDGNINIGFGESILNLNKDNFILENIKTSYRFSAASRNISGPIKRDLRLKVPSIESVFDKLKGLDYEQTLTDIGRNPYLARVAISSGDGQNKVSRNPGLAESRELVYEFALEDNIGLAQDERDRLSKTDPFALEDLSRRDMSRADIFNLNPLVPGNLLEILKGTAVDIHGNILDINRNVVLFEDIDLNDVYSRVEKEDIYLRRSIKYHFEINSKKAPKKEFVYNSIDGLDALSEKIGYSHSRWSIDVDGEGLTKINIPASSDVGNIPLLSRYTNQNIKENNLKSSFRDETNPSLDVIHLGFGSKEGEGISIPDNYAPSDYGDRFEQSKFKYRTAYHDIVNTASELFSGSKAVSDDIDNRADSVLANAGGRSVHLNLDGSLEMNVGKDNVDGKSIVQDLSGSIISRIGKDLKSNSIVSQLDGNIKVYIGGDTIESESKLSNPTLTIQLESDSGIDEISINNSGIFIRSAVGKNIVLDSGNNLILNASGQTFIGGEQIHFYGTPNLDSGDSFQAERLLMRSGRKVF